MNEGLEHLIDATVRASHRSRWVHIVLVVSSILAFTGSWNIVGSGWFARRLQLARDVANHYDALQDGKTGTNAYPGLKEDEIAKLRQYFTMRSNSLPQTAELAKTRLEGEYASIRDLRTEHFVLVRVPFFGFSFDANDLGFFSGMSSVCILIMLHFSLERERKNLCIAFSYARELEGTANSDVVRGSDQGIHLLTFNILSANQVFTIPPTESGRALRSWMYLPKLLILLPAFSQAFILLHDYTTYETGKLIDPSGSFRVLMISIFSFLTISILAAANIKSSLGIDKLWTEEADRLQGKGT
jgi:hypothetical protein